MVDIYKEAKANNRVKGFVLVILAEDETKIKACISWDTRSDGPVDFCGVKENHLCISIFRQHVGNGESGYATIVASFRQPDKGSFSWIIMVNPLHIFLPKFVFVVSYTCNRLNFIWVCNQWKTIDTLWQDSCGHICGPIVGHSSDGDSRRRQLMVQDYCSKVELRNEIPWECWSLSCE